MHGLVYWVRVTAYFATVTCPNQACRFCDRYQKPTPIQAQALPAALAGRDILVRTYMIMPGKSCLDPLRLIDTCLEGMHMNEAVLVSGYRKDWVRQDGSLCPTHACAHHGPA